MTTPLANPRLRYIVGVTVIVVAGLLWWAIAAWNQGAEARAIRHLPLQERKALYDRTLGTLRDACGEGTLRNGLDAFCRGQAEFILQFPECDSACIALARRYLARPSK